ncbi:MAG: hypothetical protein RBS43_02810 [Candidatus Cloacimonas sp.]|nr:hypothetical protein [Candidatus Cloacimonas sp.]
MMRYYGHVIMLCVAFFVVSCGTHNPMQPQNDSPDQLLFTEDKLPLENGQFLYKQVIELNNPSPHCLFAYRPETYSSQLPVGYFADEGGYLYFRSSGDNSNLPLSEPGAHRTIWTSQSRLSAEFSSTDGKINNLVTQITVQIKDDRGKISFISSPFKSNRIVGSRIVSPNLNGEECGIGLEFVLQEIIGDIFVEGLYAHHFMYRLNILNYKKQAVQRGTWYSSIDSPDIRKVLLNSTTTPALITNEPNQFTQFECYVVSRSGIEEASHRSVFFRALAGYKPVALFYPQTIAGLGQHHYSLTDEDQMSVYELIPSASYHKNRKLFNVNNQLEAIYSADFKLHLRWGYSGQYGIVYSTNTTYTNNPWDRELNSVLNSSGMNYHSKITAFDLRFEGSPFPLNSSFIEPQLVTHADGSSWLRVRNLNDSARHYVFSNLSSGIHQFQVCAVDLQGAISDPATLNINLVLPKPANQRSGILLVDDSANNNNYSPEATVNNFYNAVIPTNWGTPVRFETDAGNGNLNEVSPTIMQNYKAIFWHNDNPIANGVLSMHADALELYLSEGGNLVLSSSNKLADSFSCFAPYQDFLSNRFGIASTAQFAALSQSVATNAFFINGIGQNGLSNIALNLNTAFNNLVALRQGLSAITYFNPDAGLNYLHKFGCKPVDAAVYPPTQAQYELYSDKYVAYKYSHAGSQVVVFGFPLSYMVQADVAAGLQSVFGDILGEGGRP